MTGPAVEITSSPGSALRFRIGLAVAMTVFLGLVALGCVAGLLLRSQAATDTFAAVVIGAVGVWGASRGVRHVRDLRGLAYPYVLARLDADGLHLHDGLVGPDGPDGPGDAAWTTVPWTWVTAVTHTRLDLRAAKLLGLDEAVEVLRFTLGDDRLLDVEVTERVDQLAAAQVFALTPAQARTLFVEEGGRAAYDDVLAWLRTHRPDTPVLTGRALPWSSRADADAEREQGPRVAVIGASGRLGRQVVDVLVRREKAVPVALTRNEAHRARLEAAGAEVRMVDLDQGPVALGYALRGCAGVVHLGPTDPDTVGVVVEAARRSRVSRLLLVPGGWTSEQAIGVAAASGLAWTAFRPSVLTDDAPTGEVQLGHDVVAGPVPRADLAEVVVASIRDEASSGDAWPIAGAPAPQSDG
jgi:hypothetical protein